MSFFIKDDNVWNRYLFPFQNQVENLNLPDECSQIRFLQNKYEESKSILKIMEDENKLSIFDQEDFDKVNEYILQCKKDLDDFIEKTKMSEEMVTIAIEMEKLNIRNEKIKLILKKINPLSPLTDYFINKQENLHSIAKTDFQVALLKNVDHLQFSS